MATYSSTPLGFWHLVKNCFTSYMPIYKKAWPIILVAAFLMFLEALVQAPVVIMWITIVIFFLIRAFINAMIFHEGNQALAAHPVPAHDSYVAAKTKYFSFLLCFFVLYLLLKLLFLSVFIGIVGTMGIDTSTLAYYLASTPPAISSWLGWLCWLLAILFFVLLFFVCFAPALVVTKNLDGIAALKESAELVKWHWWRVLGILAVIFIFIGIVFYFVDIIYPVDSIIIVAIRAFIFTILIYPLIIGTTLTLLHDLQLRHK